MSLGEHISWCNCLNCHLSNNPYFFGTGKINEKHSLIFFVYNEAIKSYLGLFVSKDNLSHRHCMILKPSQTSSAGIPEKWVRRHFFEKSLEKFPKINPRPSCFVSFNVEELEVVKFLKKQLVPDLELAGFQTHFCCRDLKYGDDLYDFMDYAYEDDMLVVICTPGLQEKLNNKTIGLSYEIKKMIRARIENRGLNNIRVFPISYSGPRKESCPPFLLPSFTSKLLTDSDKEWKTNYFANAIKLFAPMRGLSRDNVSKEIEEWEIHLQNRIPKEEILRKRKNCVIKSEAKIEEIIGVYTNPLTINNQLKPIKKNT